MCHDNYPLTPSLPYVPSQEAAGPVVEVGEGVDPGLIGKRVLGATLFQEGYGGLADECLMAEQGVFEIPDEMSGREAAGFFIPFQTAWVGLVHRAKLSPEDSVLVLGASGSSGAAAVQLAKAKGAHTIAVAGGERRGLLRGPRGGRGHRPQGGGHHETGARADGREGGQRSVRSGRREAGTRRVQGDAFEGRYVVIGYASGEWARIALAETLMTNISLVGAMPVGFSRAFFEESFRDLLGHWSKGELRVTGATTFSFEEGAKAIAHIADRLTEGKVVVDGGQAS